MSVSRLRGPGPARTADAAAWAATAELRILVVDAELQECSEHALTELGLRVTWCAEGTDALVVFGEVRPDAVVIAPSLPDLSPVSVVAAMRRFGHQPILLGIGADEAELAGPVLFAGATGAVARPYDPYEIVQRVAVDLGDLPGRGRFAFGPLELDSVAHSVRWAGEELATFPLKEFALLRLLLRYADQLVPTDVIRATLWSGSDAPPSTNAVAVHVARLRARLRPPIALRTVRGLGYRLTLDP